MLVPDEGEAQKIVAAKFDMLPETMNEILSEHIKRAEINVEISSTLRGPEIESPSPRINRRKRQRHDLAFKQFDTSATVMVETTRGAIPTWRGEKTPRANRSTPRAARPLGSGSLSHTEASQGWFAGSFPYRNLLPLHNTRTGTEPC